MAGIKYHEAEDIKNAVRRIITVLEMDHVNAERVFCIRSLGTSSNNIIARCHTLPKIMQQVLEIEPAYIIEILSEKFDRMSEEDRMKTLIHELLHIPKTFGGGFRHHDFVQRRTVDKFYKEFIRNEKKFDFSQLPVPKFKQEEEKIVKEEDKDPNQNSLWDFNN
jgi:predicted metallopeptidase